MGDDFQEREDERTDVVNSEMVPKVSTPKLHRRRSSLVESYIEEAEHIVIEAEDQQ